MRPTHGPSLGADVFLTMKQISTRMTFANLTMLVCALFAARVNFFLNSPIATAECPNDCSGNGVCVADDYCVCFSEWRGEDCSISKLFVPAFNQR